MAYWLNARRVQPSWDTQKNCHDVTICGMTAHDTAAATKEACEMKVTVDVDCSPAEARAFLGLPDVSPIHDKYVKTVLDSLEGTINVEQMETLFKSFSPLGDAGMRLFQQMMNIGLSGMGGGSKDGKK
ncbi:hypothetical protein J3E64_001825 [Sphingobium sp. OAS761]|nr:hypothetical protein [Sphingobium sp. OAS761]